MKTYKVAIDSTTTNLLSETARQHNLLLTCEVIHSTVPANIAHSETGMLHKRSKHRVIVEVTIKDPNLIVTH